MLEGGAISNNGPVADSPTSAYNDTKTKSDDKLFIVAPFTRPHTAHGDYASSITRGEGKLSSPVSVDWHEGESKRERYTAAVEPKSTPLHRPRSSTGIVNKIYNSGPGTATPGAESKDKELYLAYINMKNKLHLQNHKK